jgi:hypothetical protein
MRSGLGAPFPGAACYPGNAALTMAILSLSARILSQNKNLLERLSWPPILSFGTPTGAFASFSVH